MSALILNRVAVVLAILTAFSLHPSANAALPPEVKKELSTLSRELRSVTGLVRRQKVDEARELIAKVDSRLEELNIDENERDRSYTAFQASLQRAKAAIPVSFESEVAPILKDQCLRCHGPDQAGANLRMDTFAGMTQGGRSGPLLIPRNPQRSLILARLTATGQGRMPRGGSPLSAEQIHIIGRWIAGGAPFDGTDRNAPIGTSGSDAPAPKPTIKVVMADGSETVSFKDDVAPWMVNVCLRCHSGNNARGGFNITTFEQLLSGGDTGSTIVPGDPDSSYVVDLVLRQDPIKMPAGNQTRIKRSEAMALEKWIAEGAHFDGTDPKATLRSLVPTQAQMQAASLANMSDSEFTKRREEQAESLWKRVTPRQEATAAAKDNLYVYGNVPQSRLDELAQWGEEQVGRLKSKYGLADGSVWRGRLIVFVTKERFDYEEFNTVLMNRRTPRGVSGHVVVTPAFDTAYVAMHDVGDTASADSLAAHELLNSLIAQAFLSRSGADLPDWLQQGFGLLETQPSSDSTYFGRLPQTAAGSLGSISNPASLFDDGTFPPEEVGAVGFLLTRYLINNGGVAKLSQFVKQIESGRNAGQAIQTVYGIPARNLGQAFLQSGGR